MKQKTELTDKQMKAIELLAQGETVSNTAKIVGVNRKTISEWKKIDKFKDELDKCVADIKLSLEDKLRNAIEPMTERLIKIALTSNDKTSLDAIVYAFNRLYGTPTNKTQDVTTVSADNSKPADINALIQEIQDVAVDQVVKLPKAN